MERHLVEYFLSNYHHGWMSQETQAEAYNETWRDSKRVELVKEFIEKNPSAGAQFCKKAKPGDPEDLCFQLIDDDIAPQVKSKPKDKKTFCGMFEIHRKNLGQAYYNLWIYEELVERKMLKKYLFGPYYIGIYTCLI